MWLGIRRLRRRRSQCIWPTGARCVSVLSAENESLGDMRKPMRKCSYSQRTPVKLGVKLFQIELELQGELDWEKKRGALSGLRSLIH